MKNRISVTLLFLLLVQFAIAGDDEWGLTNNVSELLNKHVKVDQYGKYNPGKISSTFYKLVITELLLNPNDRSKININDLKYLENLPSHMDKTFVSKDYLLLASLCTDIKKGNGKDVVDFSRDFDELRNFREQELLTHYKNVLTQVSYETREVINNKIVSMTPLIDMNEMSINLAALALDDSDVAEEILNRKCIEIDEKYAGKNFPSITLKQESDALAEETSRGIALGK